MEQPRTKDVDGEDGDDDDSDRVSDVGAKGKKGPKTAAVDARPRFRQQQSAALGQGADGGQGGDDD